MLKEKKKHFEVYHGQHSYCTFYRTKSGFLMCFGSNSNGELGIGSKERIWNPTRAKLFCKGKGIPPKLKIIQIVNGYSFAAFLTSEYNVYSSGRHNYGQLGIGIREGEFDFYKNPSGKKKIAQYPEKILKYEINRVKIQSKMVKIIRLCAGIDHLLLQSTKYVFGTGRNGEGQLGCGNYRHKYSPVVVRLPKDEKVVSMSASNCSVFLMKSHRLYITGKILYSSPMSNVPKKIDLKFLTKSGERIISSINGDYHVCLLSNYGRVFSAGGNSDGQLGIGKIAQYESNTFSFVEGLKNEKIVEIASGYYHNLALSDKGKVYSWGRNYHFQCSISRDINKGGIFLPTLVPNMKDIVQIEGGSYHSYVFDKDGNMFVVGESCHCQLGMKIQHNSVSSITLYGNGESSVQLVKVNSSTAEFEKIGETFPEFTYRGRTSIDTKNKILYVVSFNEKRKSCFLTGLDLKTGKRVVHKKTPFNSKEHPLIHVEVDVLTGDVYMSGREDDNKPHVIVYKNEEFTEIFTFDDPYYDIGGGITGFDPYNKVYYLELGDIKYDYIIGVDVSQGKIVLKVKNKLWFNIFKFDMLNRNFLGFGTPYEDFNSIGTMDTKGNFEVLANYSTYFLLSDSIGAIDYENRIFYSIIGDDYTDIYVIAAVDLKSFDVIAKPDCDWSENEEIVELNKRNKQRIIRRRSTNLQKNIPECPYSIEFLK